jgi:hypothetical protein
MVDEEPVRADSAVSLNVPFQNVAAATTQKTVAMAAPTPAALTFGDIGLLEVPFAIESSVS